MRLPVCIANSFMVVCAIALGGCSCSTSPTGSGNSPEAPEVRNVPASKLAPLGDPSPTSDPAVEAAGPQGWKRLPRNDQQYLIGWYGGSNRTLLPRIFVRAEDWKGKASDTTSDNLTELTAEIDQSLQGGKNILEWPHAMLLDGDPWVRYVDEARLGSAKAERQILQRVINGRLFTVELQVYTRNILESRDQAYAVAAGLQFKSPESSRGNPTEPAENPPTDTPPENLPEGAAKDNSANGP